MVRLLACALVLKVTASVILNYHDYMPPNFASGFLLGREHYFWAGYHWAFYLHVTSGPCALIVGIILMSERFRRRFSIWHRYLGRFQTACVLLLVVPSGGWMALYTETGAVAGLGFTVLGAVTGVCALLGWRSAVRGRSTEHRRWMSRCFVLLCSAVVLRLIGGMFAVAGIDGDWTYSLAAWISWLGPLAAFEFIQVGYNASEHASDRRPQPSN